MVKLIGMWFSLQGKGLEGDLAQSWQTQRSKQTQGVFTTSLQIDNVALRSWSLYTIGLGWGRHGEWDLPFWLHEGIISKKDCMMKTRFLWTSPPPTQEGKLTAFRATARQMQLFVSWDKLHPSTKFSEGRLPCTGPGAFDVMFKRTFCKGSDRVR